MDPSCSSLLSLKGQNGHNVGCAHKISRGSQVSQKPHDDVMRMKSEKLKEEFNDNDVI